MLQFMIRYRLWLTTQFNNSTEQKNIFSYFQISALQKRIGSIIENAGKSGVNIICLQEAWSTSSETIKFSFFSINYFQQCPLPSVQEKNIHGLSLLNLLRLVPQLCFCLRWHLLDRYLTLILESISNNFEWYFQLAARYRMVIISPILERDEDHGDTLWNTAVVIDHTGRVIGKTRKNHIPRVGDFNESTYYLEESVNTKFK